MNHIIVLLFICLFNAFIVALTGRRFGYCMPVSLMSMSFIMYIMQFVTGSFKPAFLHSLDVFVLPSNYEGFGIALIEALSCGIPVVTSALQGPEEIFHLAAADQLSIGRTCPAGDPAAFAAAIAEVLSHQGAYDPATLHAFVERRFGKDQAVTAHLDLYQRLLAAR